MANVLYIIVSIIALILLFISIIVASIGATNIKKIAGYSTNEVLKTSYSFMVTIAILSAIGILIYLAGVIFIIYDSVNREKSVKNGLKTIKTNNAIVPILAILTGIVVIIVIINGVLGSTVVTKLISSNSLTGGSFTIAYNMAIVTAVINLVVMAFLLFSFLIYFYIRSSLKSCIKIEKQKE